MENRIKFTEDGLKTFALVVLSCYPVHHELNVQAMMYLRSVVSGQEKLNAELLLQKLPDLKKSLVEFAKRGRHEEVSSEAVAEFFAGSSHYEKIMQEFEEKKLHILPGSVYSLRTIFAHLVLPVSIVGREEDGFIGKYVNGQHEILVRGLVATRRDARLLDGLLAKNSKIIVFTHFATIIEINPSHRLVSQVAEMLRQAEFFVSACGYL
ncbi:MAG TPA: hypothetical protein DCX32_00545, partial [Candidatus Moranbacteria bacterium]|nr:hypothetical protein [Candidatus Moranbacteria bacterium]